MKFKHGDRVRSTKYPETTGTYLEYRKGRPIVSWDRHCLRRHGITEIELLEKPNNKPQERTKDV